MRIKSLLLLASCVWASSAWSAVRHVPADYPTVQLALNASSSGDQVLVAAGTYHENLVLGAAQNGVVLTSESGAAVTILDGSAAGTVIRCSAVGNTTVISGFTITNGGGGVIGAGLNLSGASPRIENNWIHDNLANVAGGMYVDGGAPTLTGNTIRDNRAQYGSGGGIYYDHFAGGRIAGNLIEHNLCAAFGGGLSLWEGSNPLVEDNQILRNEAVNGGGCTITRGSSPTLRGNQITDNLAPTGSGGGLLCTLDSSPTIEGNTIASNRSASGGGCFFDYAPAPTLRGNIIRDNQAPYGSGGGIYCDHSSNPLIQSNVIARNSCGAYGGGISLWEGSNPRVWSNTLVQNQGPLGGGGIYLTRSAGADLQRNILAFHSVGGGLVRDASALTPTFGCNDAWSNAPSSYQGVPNPTGTGGNFAQDPLFCDLGTLDLHLEATSPCATLLSPPGCNLVGALDVSCGPTRVRRSSWGSLKAGYR